MYKLHKLVTANLHRLSLLASLASGQVGVQLSAVARKKTIKMQREWNMNTTY